MVVVATVAVVATTWIVLLSELSGRCTTETRLDSGTVTVAVVPRDGNAEGRRCGCTLINNKTEPEKRKKDAAGLTPPAATTTTSVVVD